MAIATTGPVWVNAHSDPVTLVVGKLRRILARLRPGARQLIVRTSAMETVHALGAWCQDNGVYQTSESRGDGWIVTLYLLPTQLGECFRPPSIDTLATAA